MKKILIVVFLSLIAFFLILMAALVIIVATFDANSLKPKIVSAAKEALGRPVDFSSIDLKFSFKRGIELDLANVSIGEDPDFGKDDFFTAKKVSLALSVQELIFKRNINATAIICNEPRINIIRLKDGRINAQAFKTGGTEQDKAFNEKTLKPLQQAPALFIDEITLDQGRLTYLDYSFEPKISIILDTVSVAAQKLTLTQAFPFTVKARCASRSDNIFVKGKAQIDIGRQSLRLMEITAESDLSSLESGLVLSFIPQLAGLPLPEIKTGVLSVELKECEVGAKGLTLLKGQGALTKGSLRMTGLAVPVEPVEAFFTMSESVLALTNASIDLGKGKIKLSGDISDYLNKQEYELKIIATGIDLRECVDQASYPVKVKGVVTGDFKLKGRGFDPALAVSSLSGTGTVAMKEGQLTDINVLKLVLDKLSFVPNISSILQANLPEGFKEQLSKKDTVITNFSSGLALNNNLISLQPIEMQAESFSFSGNGMVGLLDQAYSLEGAFVIGQEMSRRMVKALAQMELLLDASQQIRFPLTVKGQGGVVSFMPEVKQMGTSILKQKGLEQLKKVFENKVESKESIQETGQNKSSNTQDPSANPQEKNTKQDLIDGIIGPVTKE